MTSAPSAAAAAPTAAALWRGSDRLSAPLRPARAALGRLERLGRAGGPVLRQADRAVFLLAPGAAEPVPELLGWLGWGPELGLPIEARAAHPGDPRVPEPRTADWLRAGTVRPALDLRSPDLLHLLDALADACARERLGLPPAR
ncbi:MULTISPECIES: hypothetical protein [Kitasatospora]|uniref:Uncharacterized protein n=1 Tax=Kitasatospora setae (strain ATCC 33774 / DSM 43861 / JCM 3304 / KCC A-0304 / NBRC 14216 / KM-6054) TaxID=452652 RepID=E4NDD8_KITSK|nr:MULTISPECIES: hypothetical protein [Kitasatospora]BAJ29219.1 hypothetical protein KSE_34120 [Kitasatospora setae KM-6054]